jgi:hypothetical protein
VFVDSGHAGSRELPTEEQNINTFIGFALSLALGMTGSANAGTNTMAAFEAMNLAQTAVKNANSLNERFGQNVKVPETESVTESEVGFHFRFVQKHHGLPLKGSVISVTVTHGHEVVAYHGRLEPSAVSQVDPHAVASDFFLSEGQASQIAYEATNLTASPSFQKIEKKFQKVGDEFRPVYEITFSAPIDKKWSWQVNVEGKTGTVVDSFSTALDAHENQFARIPVNVFDPNPTVRSGLIYGSVPGFLDNANSNSDFFDQMMKQTELETTLENGRYVLANRYAVITDQELPRNPDCSTPFGSMILRRADPCFDSINALYHITKSLKYVGEVLHIDVHPRFYEGPMHVDPNGLDGDDNSHFLPSTDELAYGIGGIHDAQDHDVLLHELAHAIHTWITHGHFSNVEGLAEGIADYWAASYSRRHMKKTNPAYNWVYSFDGHNEFWPGRVVNNPLKYPEGVLPPNNEIHIAGSVFSTVCIAISDQIGKLATDRILWAGVAMLDENSNQLDAAKAMTVAARVLFVHDPKRVATVKRIFRDHGYLVP